MKSIRLALLTLLLSVCSFAQATYTANYTTYRSVALASSDTFCVTQNCWYPEPGISGYTISRLSAASDGSLWAVTSNGHAFQHTLGTNAWVDKSANKAGYLAQVTVANSVAVFARTTLGHNLAYDFTTNQWVQFANDNYPPASGTALLTSDISVGADGDIWVVGPDTLGCGKRLYHRPQGTNSWLSTNYGGIQVAVGNANNVWYRCSDNSVRVIVNTTSQVIAGAVATDLSVSDDGMMMLIGADGATPFTYTNGNVTGGEAAAADAGSCCNRLYGTGKQLAVGGNTHTYLVNSAGLIYHLSVYRMSAAVTVQGTTTCSGTGCPGQLGTNTQHTGHVSVTMPGNSVAQTSSQATPWNSYLQTSTSDSTSPMWQGECISDFVTPQSCGDFMANIHADIICPFMGSVLAQDFGSVVNRYTETAHTLAKYPIGGTVDSCLPTGTPPIDRCHFHTVNWCTPGTTPPDAPITFVQDNAPAVTQPSYWWVTKICVRLFQSDPWSCSPYNRHNAEKLPSLISDTYPHQPCTHNP